jgi:hypothetical protein
MGYDLLTPVMAQKEQLLAGRREMIKEPFPD